MSAAGLPPFAAMRGRHTAFSPHYSLPWKFLSWDGYRLEFAQRRKVVGHLSLEVGVRDLLAARVSQKATVWRRLHDLSSEPVKDLALGVCV